MHVLVWWFLETLLVVLFQKLINIRNMASSITNRRLHIAWGFFMIFFILFDLFIGSLGFDNIFF
jgi:hypothetical protein